MLAQDVRRLLGMSAESWFREATLSRPNRLADRGWLRKTPTNSAEAPAYFHCPTTGMSIGENHHANPETSNFWVHGLTGAGSSA
jgi:hypothetical protein